MMSNNSRKNNVVITGSSDGIGFELARDFLQSGWVVYGISRSNAQFDSTDYHQINADMYSTVDLEKAISILSKENIDVLINNVGAHGPIGEFASIEVNDWIKTFTLNLFSPLKLTQKMIPTLRRNKGTVIFLSGGGAAYPVVNFSSYGVSKTAVVRMAEVLSKELYPDVFVYSIAPGPNRTKLLEKAIAEGDVVPEERIVNFDKPVNLVRYLVKNNDFRLSGKFIHVNDDYKNLLLLDLDDDKYTLRRMS